VEERPSAPLVSRRTLLLACAGGGVVGLAGCSIFDGDDRPRLNVKDFGAVGDGTKDDGPAFHRALAKAESAGGAVIEVPAGTYALSEQGTSKACLDLPANTTLHGEGTLTHVPSITRLSVSLIGIARADVAVHGLTLLLESAPGGRPFGVAVRDGARDAMLSDLMVRDNPVRGGIQVIGGKATTIRRCTITRMAQNGMTLYGKGVGKGPRGVEIDQCTIDAHVQPIDSEPVEGATCDDVVVTDCTLTSTGGNYGITLLDTNDAVVRRNTITGAVHLTRSHHARFEDNRVDASEAGGDRNAVDVSQDAQDLTFSRNRVTAPPGRVGMRIARGVDRVPRAITVTGNTFDVSDPGSMGVEIRDATDLTLSDNRIRGRDSGGGISVTAQREVVTVAITKNRIGGFSTGISARANGRGRLAATIKSNDVDDNTVPEELGPSGLSVTR